MGIAQWLYVSLLFVGLLISANEHGKERNGKNNFWVSALGAAVAIGILAWGGFFS